ETINETKRLQNNTRELANLVSELMKKLDKIDFPARLDKIDASISTINSTIQNVFSRLDIIERNLKDDINLKMTILNENLNKTKKIYTILLTLNLSFTIIILFLIRL
ncbi:MAG: hypothetical protein GXO78_06025, partial [Calditrichaeota bacterium]|nr:hypothetical protein [Calditrichota bacterium]